MPVTSAATVQAALKSLIEGPSRVDWQLFWRAGLIVAAGLGLWARFIGLGASSLAVDEYYLLTSAQNILRHAGLPAFDCAGYYARGLLHQYASAGLLMLELVPEIAIRLPSVIADITAVVGAYFLAQHVAGRRVAAFVAILLCLSLWQIEFARFGRMYAIFQACTVWYVLATVKFLESSDRRHYSWMIGISIIAVLGHEGGALLAAFTLFALIPAPNRPSAIQIVMAVAVLGAAIAMLMADLRYQGVSDPYASELLESITVAGEGAFVIDLPHMGLMSAATLSALLIIAACAALWLVQTYLRSSGTTNARDAVLSVIAWIVIVAALSLQLYLLAATVLLVAMLFAVINPRALREKRMLAALVLSAGLLIASSLAQAHFAGEEIVTVVKRGLRYPDFYLEVFLPWMKVLPGMTIAIGTIVGAAASVVLFGSQQSSEYRSYRWLLGVTVVLLLAAVLSRQPYYSTRYTYFVYPLLLVLLIQGALILQRRFIPGATSSVAPWLMIATVFVVSNDFSIKHLLRVGTPEYLYRTHYSPALANHFYDRWDYRSVAAQLNANADSGDLVITTAYPVLPFYTKRVDTVYLDRTDSRIWIVSCRGGRTDLWSNLPLMSDPDALRSTIENATGIVWLVLPTERREFRKPIEAELLNRYRRNEVFRSIDGHLALLRIP